MFGVGHPLWIAIDRHDRQLSVPCHGIEGVTPTSRFRTCHMTYTCSRSGSSGRAICPVHHSERCLWTAALGELWLLWHHLYPPWPQITPSLVLCILVLFTQNTPVPSVSVASGLHPFACISAPIEELIYSPALQCVDPCDLMEGPAPLLLRQQQMLHSKEVHHK